MNTEPNENGGEEMPQDEKDVATSDGTTAETSSTGADASPQEQTAEEHQEA